ncbi:MAG: translation initiation factor IF-2 [Candidatus Choladocola sp.]|nr:translation initiation factor IF-2 [Candidatus Choladocola sp.]
MAKIRVHELARELGKENKDIMAALQKMGIEVKSHMSNVEEADAGKVRTAFQTGSAKIKEDEHMQQNTDTDAVKKTEAEPAAQPKKKNIIQVFRPQNSKTGMVKPGSRPRPQGQAGARPQGQPGARPQGQAGARPQGQPGVRPQAAAGTRPVRPQTADTANTAETVNKEAVTNTPANTSAGTPVKTVPAAEAPVRKDAAAQEIRQQPQSTPKSQPEANQQTQQESTVQQSAARTQNVSGGRNDGQNRGQGNRYQNDGQNRGQGNRYQNDGQSRGQGNSYQNDGQNRGQGNRDQGDGQNRGQGNRYQGDGQNRSQGGRYQNDGQNRGQGGRSVNIPKAPVESKPLEKESRKRTERGDRNRNDKGEKLERMEKNVRQNQKGAPKKGQQTKAPVQKPAEKPEETIRTITIPEKLTISELAEAMKVQPSAIVKKLFLQGTMVTVNQEVDFDKAEEIALEFNCICEKEVKVNVLEELVKEEDDPEETLVPRSPVVCVMGHVDHGKTSLLDAIRNTHVIDKEAGGITQHIGAYVVSIDGQKITFLDTPGHEAFTAMRMRGANATDIAILVVAADDGVMPQTVEAINHAKAAGIEIIVAINKIDKPSANVERVKQELSEYELIPEDWGGSTIFVPVSAHTHEGIDTLLEMILLTAEVAELRANPKRKARGLVIEAELDKGKGPVATVLVQKGTLHVGDPVAAGSCYGKVRAMMDDKGRRVKEAGPSTPVEILGFSDVPNAGEIFMAMDNEKEARSFAETFISEGRERLLEDTKARMSLDDLFSQIQAGNLKELDIIVKADVQGSVEAVKQSLLKLSNDEVIVKIIHGGVGAINESDVILASASNAIIIGFNVRPDVMAKATAEREGVDIRLYRVIYDAIADVEAAMKGMLDPVFEEKVIGHAEVRQTFKASGVGTIAGGYVTDGIFQRACSVRISREGTVIYEGSLASLKRFKDDVKEVKAGYECGLVFEKCNDIKEGDTVEAFIMVEVPR